MSSLWQERHLYFTIIFIMGLWQIYNVTYHLKFSHYPNFQSVHWLLVFATVIALSLIGFAGYSIHKRIEEKIALLEEL